MSRRAVIIILGVLIIGVVGGTAALIISRLRQNQDQTTGSSSGNGSLSEAPSGNQQTIDPTADDDGDGLINADEALWGTSRTNPDTDGDGYQDGEEVDAGHNPTIAAPNDLLPEGFVPGRELNPLNTAANQPIAVDQYFSDNLDLSGGNKNLTEAYRQQFPEEQRTSDTLAEFASQQPIVTQLPAVRPETLDVAATDGPLATATYLQTAGNLDVFTDRIRITDAISRVFEKNDPSYVISLAHTVRLQQQVLLETRVPPSGESLHKLLIGYMELYAATFEQIGQYPTDPVKATVALYQLEAIDQKFYPLITQEIQRLTNVAGISGATQ